ncbi:Leukotriene A-4 hydrolase [Symbiodinium microadriaticum]|uniref:GrpE protein homolog n=1 Tax=Symbiodinium microadriaticum TaxID=2951 RepID=A0A1Q9D8S1_SYMMI|nr:Leukotriene A-4 hydrolase [Symbiodinium microadriaticum]
MLNKQGSSGLTRLEPDIDDIDPDDAFSRVPYEKGSLFLFYLEQLVGGEEPMTKYLQSYIQKFRGRSIQTSDMKAHFIEFFKGVGELKQVDWELWLHGEGIPDFDLTAHVDKTLLEESRQAAKRWLVETPQDLQIMSLKAQQVMLILDHLINALADGQSLSHEKLAAMDGQYNLSGTRNVEIGFRFLFDALPRGTRLSASESLERFCCADLLVMAEALKFGSLPDEDDARLESKAAALLNLVSHGAFGETEKADSKDQKAKPGEAAQRIISVLSAVAQPEDGDPEEGRGTKRKQEENVVAESPAVVFEEPLDWQVRLRKLNVGVDPISLDMIIKWVTEAAEDSQAQFSAEIIKSGIAEFLRRVSKEAIPEVLVRERQAFTNKLKEAGFAEMAKALDLAIRSMQFSEKLQKGSPQMCLNMQTKESMTAYMNMVIRGCDRQGWPMRRVFLGHLSRVALKSAEGEADGIAPSEALIEFGKAGGWKYVMSWLDEEPQPTTWPPYSVLDELGSNIPSQAPLKLFALLHRALTHPGFAASMAPSLTGLPAPCLSRLERQLTRAAAPALDLNLDEPRDEKLQRKLQDIASLGGQVGNLFDFLEKLLTFASKVRHPKLEDGTPGTTAWLDLQSESRDLVSVYKGLADTPAIGWTSVLKLVAGLTQDLDEIIRENIKGAQQREANAKEEERARLLDEAKARVEANTGTVLSLLANGKLRERSSSGLQDCLGKMKRLGDSMQHLEQLDKSAKTAQSVDTWEAGRAAVKGFCQLKVRCSKALHWLQKRQLGHCAKLLDSAGLLESLELVKDAQKLKSLGLPFRCQELLISCAENDGLAPGHLEPKLEEVPDVWEQRTSRNLNLQYFQKVGSSAMSWEWPLPAGLVAWRTDGSAGELLQQQEEDQLLASARRISGAPKPGCPAFVAEGSCLLCQQDATDSHWASPEHRKHAAYWKQLADRLAMICVDLQRLPEEASQSGLAAAWRGELWQALRMPPLPPATVLAVFWRRVVLWSLSASCPSLLDHDVDTVDGLRERLQFALSVAKIAEKEQDRREEHERALAKVKAQAAKLVPLIDPDRLRKKAAHIAEAVAAIKEARLALVAAPLHTRSPSTAYAIATLRRSEDCSDTVQSPHSSQHIPDRYVPSVLRDLVFSMGAAPPSVHRRDVARQRLSAASVAVSTLGLWTLTLGTCAWVPPQRGLPRTPRSAYRPPQEQLAMVAASLRRERAMIEEKQEQLQRTAAMLSKEKRRIEGELTEQAIELQEFKSKAEATLKAERAALEKEKARLAKESEALAMTQQSLMQRAESMSKSAKDADSNEQSLELIEAVRREKAALKRGRQQLRREAEAIGEARRQLEASMDRGQELEELRAKAEALEAEADALRRERTALQKQRARIHAEAEEIAEERESLEKEAKALHRVVARGEEVGKADKDLLASLRAAEQQLAQQTAEFRNFKTRVEQQEKSLGQRALAKAATPLLSVLDDFGRARLAGNSIGEVQAVLRPLRNRLVAVLESEFGIRPMPDTVGQAFNPKLHDAISIRAEDRVPPDTVVEQLEEGFCFGDSDEVLRPAKVIVSSAM